MKAAPTASIEVLFEDAHLCVLNKPAGLLSQGEHSGAPNVVDLLRQRWGRSYVGLIHRLDRNTSGLMVVAKRTKAARRLTTALQERRLKRTYQAIVQGHLAQPDTWVDVLVRDDLTNRSSPVRGNEVGGKTAHLAIRPLQSLSQGRYTLIELIIGTGRTHQIRAQCAGRGYWILGDPKYGDRCRRSPQLISRPALHAARLQFPHPMSHVMTSWDAPLPLDMERAIEHFQEHNWNGFQMRNKMNPLR